MKLIITIDVEEDNWGTYDKYNYSVNNIENIPELQCLFDKYGIIPTYLINYPVANNATAIKTFKEILKYDECEIGTHIHPWNTPPFYSQDGEKYSFLCSLPEDVQYNKLRCLHELIKDTLNVSPVSFRSGRWGFNEVVAKNIYKLGYRYDTSITPFTNWTKIGGPDFSNKDFTPFYIFKHQGDNGNESFLLEIPATIGYRGLLSRDQKITNRIHDRIHINANKYMKFNYIMRKLNIYEKIWLSPESSTLEEMILLTESIKNISIFLNVFFHSGSLLAGNTPFVPDDKAQRKFFRKIDLYLQYIRSKNIESIRLSDAGKYYKQTWL